MQKAKRLSTSLERGTLSWLKSCIKISACFPLTKTSELRIRTSIIFVNESVRFSTATMLASIALSKQFTCLQHSSVIINILQAVEGRWSSSNNCPLSSPNFASALLDEFNHSNRNINHRLPTFLSLTSAVLSWAKIKHGVGMAGKLIWRLCVRKIQGFTKLPWAITKNSGCAPTHSSWNGLKIGGTKQRRKTLSYSTLTAR